MTDTRAAGVCINVLDAAWATDKVSGCGDGAFSISSKTMEDCPKQISNSPAPRGAPQGSHGSDINKESQLTTLFTGLMPFCEVSHLSGVKSMMACVWEEIRALEDLRSLGV